MGGKSLSSLSLDDLFPHSSFFVFPDQRQFYDGLAEDCENMCKHLGTNGSWFKERMEKLLNAAPDVPRIVGLMESAAYIRPLIALWLEKPKAVPCTPELLRHLEHLAVNSRRARLGRLALRELCQLFFSRYDTLSESLDELCRVLKRQLDLYPSQELLFGLGSFKDQKDRLLQEKGHEELARLAEEHASPLADEARKHGITEDSLFFEKSLSHHYIGRLRSLKANDDSEQAKKLFLEVQKQTTYECRLSDHRRLGHEVLTILITTLLNENCSPSPLWRDTLLSIAGDPRVPKTSDSYQNWWRHIDPSLVEAMVSWLAEVDMKLFLRILKEYSQRQGDGAIQRMYPVREQFLQGLFRKKLIRKSRLFLGKDIKNYVERQYEDKVPYSAPIRDNNKLAVFYLNLGKVHLIEGTHNFKLRILEKLPPDSPLEGDLEGAVEQNDLGKNLKVAEGYFEKVHNPSGKWIYDALAWLQKHGIPLYAQDVMPEESVKWSSR